MINVSKAFKDALAEGEKLYEIVDITFADGRKKTLDSEILVGGGTFTDCAESSSFPIGITICKSMTLSLDNTEDQWKDYYFYKAKLTAYLKMQVTNTVVETIKKGTYTITTPEQYGEVLEFTALDDMYKANAPYTSNLVLPQSAFTLLRDACTTIGITMGFSSMEHGNVIINSIPEGITFRQLIGWVAMLDSANARVDVDGKLQLIKWDFDSVAVDYGATLDSAGYLVFGGGASADSEGFISPNAGNWYLDSEGFLTLREGVGNPPRLRDYTSFPTLSSDDIVITGIKVKSTESEAMYGKDGYVLELENDLLSDADIGTVAGWIGDNLIGKAFRSLEGDLAYNPISEFGDMAFTYDRRENKYITPITDITSSLNSTTTVKTQADDPIRGESKFLSNTEKTIQIAKKLVSTEKNERQQAVERLEKTLEQASGLYETNVKLEDGSTITYLHDKPLLAESKNVLKFTAEGIGVSNDGGKTYPYGFILDGTTITRILYAVGINADYVNSGSFKVVDDEGKIIFQADMDTKKVYMDGSVQIGGGKTIGEIQETAENAMKAAALAKNMTLQLSNEYQGISVDSDGNYGTFPSGVTTQAAVMYGTQDITSECTYTISTSDSITGSWNSSTKTYTVTGLTADSGWVDIKATYISTLSVTKRFSLSKLYAGEQGEAGRTYFIELSANILKRGQNKIVSPTTVEGRAYYRDGSSAERTAYAGRWKIETSTNGTDFKSLSSSTADETKRSCLVSLLGESIISVRFTLYAAGGTTTPLDTQTIPILVDVAALTHEQIFNLLTDDGAIKGIYKEGNQLYISFTYAKGGTLKLGGPNNGYGTFEVYDASGNLITQINNSVGFKNIKGEEWFQIKESVATAGYGEEIDGLLDLSAQYEDGRNVVLEAITGDLVLKMKNSFRLVGMKALTGGNTVMFNPYSTFTGYASSSSSRYKVVGNPVEEKDIEDLYDIKVVWAKYKDEYLSEKDERYGKEMPMFLAEDIDNKFSIAADHDDQGRAENWNYRIMIPCMFSMIKNDHEKISSIQAELENLKSELQDLKKLILKGE
nr:MAG TPA: Receptor recognition protein, Long tail, Helical sandwich, Tail fiber [Caudoviricetes sp.]